LLPDKPQLAALRADILAWYAREQRRLPWRGQTDPYRVWLAEVMLQQTQVMTVQPYYLRFLARFPTVAALAAAPLDNVLKLWAGLGYYARARNLHRAAQKIVAEQGGQFPQDYAGWRTLPGCGDYIAGAVASIAFGQAVPAIDGNVKRALARLFAIEADVSRGDGARRLKAAAAALLAPTQPGDWTQALIELGATVCLPKSPRCPDCPALNRCLARRQGIELELPLKPARPTLPHIDVTAAIIENDGKILIAQRPTEGMLGGMWEFPGGKIEPGETLPQCLAREIEEELGLNIKVGAPLVSIKHSYTHFKITLHAFYCQLAAGSSAPQAIGVADWRWVTLAELENFPFPRTDQKIIRALRPPV